MVMPVGMGIFGSYLQGQEEQRKQRMAGLQGLSTAVGLGGQLQQQQQQAQMNPLLLQQAQLQVEAMRNPPPQYKTVGDSLLQIGPQGVNPVFQQQPRPQALSVGVPGQPGATQQAWGVPGQSNITPVGPPRLGIPPSPAAVVNVGGKETDKRFAEDYIAFATGGYTDTVKQLDQLREASKTLETAPEGSITGPTVGVMPRQALSVLNPQAASTLEAVEEVVQRNLRVILGAQFTEKEGERLISRSYNPYLPQSENKKRVDRLITQIGQAAEAKLSASKYYQKNGTLEGWTGKLWTMNDFNPEGPTTPGRRASDAVAPNAQEIADELRRRGVIK